MVESDYPSQLVGKRRHGGKLELQDKLFGREAGGGLVFVSDEGLLLNLRCLINLAGGYRDQSSGLMIGLDCFSGSSGFWILKYCRLFRIMD